MNPTQALRREYRQAADPGARQAAGSCSEGPEERSSASGRDRPWDSRQKEEKEERRQRLSHGVIQEGDEDKG